MQDLINIKPKTISLTSVEINLNYYKMGKSASFNVVLFDENKRPHEVFNLEIEGAEFDAWGSDDKYIKDLILAKLGLEEA